MIYYKGKKIKHNKEYETVESFLKNGGTIHMITDEEAKVHINEKYKRTGSIWRGPDNKRIPPTKIKGN